MWRETPRQCTTVRNSDTTMVFSDRKDFRRTSCGPIRRSSGKSLVASVVFISLLLHCVLFGFVRCEQDIDECESNPCLNNATCWDQVGLYSCNCSANYTGVNCEVLVSVWKMFKCDAENVVQAVSCMSQKYARIVSIRFYHAQSTHVAFTYTVLEV